MAIPTSAEMQECYRKNLEARLKRENDDYPTRWAQWEKRVEDELTECKRTEIRNFTIRPPTLGEKSKDWDPHHVTALDRRAMEEMTQLLERNGFKAVKHWSNTNWNDRRIEISWS